MIAKSMILHKDILQFLSKVSKNSNLIWKLMSFRKSPPVIREFISRDLFRKIFSGRLDNEEFAGDSNHSPHFLLKLQLEKLGKL
jgi:hypothetical protein